VSYIFNSCRPHQNEVFMRNERINASFFCIFDSFMRSKSVFEPFILSFGVHFGVHILISFSPYSKSPSCIFLEELFRWFFKTIEGYFSNKNAGGIPILSKMAFVGILWIDKNSSFINRLMFARNKEKSSGGKKTEIQARAPNKDWTSFKPYFCKNNFFSFTVRCSTKKAFISFS